MAKKAYWRVAPSTIADSSISRGIAVHEIQSRKHNVPRYKKGTSRHEKRQKNEGGGAYLSLGKKAISGRSRAERGIALLLGYGKFGI